MTDAPFDSETADAEEPGTPDDVERADDARTPGDVERPDDGEPPDETGASGDVRPPDDPGTAYDTGAAVGADGAASTDAATTPRDGIGSDNSYVNALLGALVSVVLSFLPFSPALGGAVAGYLEGRDGLRVGAVSGVFASLPLFGVVVLLGLVALGLGFADLAVGGFLLFVLGVFAVLFVVGYAVVLSALGGLVGVYLAEEFGETGRRRAAEPTR